MGLGARLSPYLDTHLFDIIIPADLIQNQNHLDGRLEKTMNKINFIKQFLFYEIVVFLFIPAICFSKIHQITNNSAYDSNPSLYNGTIAWESDIDGDMEIFYWDGSTTHQITNNSADDRYPSLYNGTIAWESNIDGDNDIFYWDGSTTIQITHNSATDSRPSLYNGTIAWVRDDGDAEIFYWDGKNSSILQFLPAIIRKE